MFGKAYKTLVQESSGLCSRVSFSLPGDLCKIRVPVFYNFHLLTITSIHDDMSSRWAILRNVSEHMPRSAYTSTFQGNTSDSPNCCSCPERGWREERGGGDVLPFFWALQMETCPWVRSAELHLTLRSGSDELGVRGSGGVGRGRK